jgi:hypothetical protein
MLCAAFHCGDERLLVYRALAGASERTSLRDTARAGTCERVSKRVGLNATMVCRYMTARNTHDGAPFPHPHGGTGERHEARQGMVPAPRYGVDHSR